MTSLGNLVVPQESQTISKLPHTGSEKSHVYVLLPHLLDDHRCVLKMAQAPAALPHKALFTHRD